MSKEFEQISTKPGFMKHNGGVLFRNISENKYEFKSIINENHLNVVTKNKISAVLGPTNTGKTHLAIETMLSFESGMIGFPLRLLAREVYDKVVHKNRIKSCSFDNW